MSHQKEPRTSAGLRLRALREACGMTQFDVELNASLGMGYLQRLELGKVQRPERETLERILAALAASPIERREILHLFGYAVVISIPDETEIQWAIQVFQKEVQQDTIPAYLLDCSHRLLAWNPLVPKLFGGVKTGTLMPRLLFDRINGIASAVLNGETFFPAQIRIIQYEQQRCGNDTWYSGFIAQMRHYEIFDQYWVDQNAASLQVPLRPLVPLKLAMNHEVAQFRLMAETFGQDQRFRVIYAIPADAATNRQCTEWQLSAPHNRKTAGKRYPGGHVRSDRLV